MHGDTLTKILAVISFSTAIGLAGCSGGGGDDSTTTFDGDTSGTVSKGIVIDGQVTADELDVSGNLLRQVGTATTDASGNYDLIIGDAYAGGVIRLTLSSDGSSTQMICDVQPDCGGVPFGSAMDLPSTFSMVALLPAVQNGDSVRAQITPFTHMAASRVAAGGSYTSDAVKSANSEINQLVGVDVLNTPPVDITDPSTIDTSSPEELVYSAFTAGVGALMFDATDLTVGLQELADTFSDGDFDTEDSVSIVDILYSVADQADESGILIPELINQLQTVAADLEDTNGDEIVDTYDPEPLDTALLSNVEQAKAVVNDIRTFASSIEELEDPASVFADELRLTNTVVKDNTQALIVFTGLVVDAVYSRTTELALDDALVLDTEFTAEIYDDGVSIGQVTFTLSASDTGGLVISLTVDDVTGVDMNLTLASNLPAADILAGQEFYLSEFTFALTGSVANAETSIVFTDTDLTLTDDGTSPTIPEPINPLNLTGDAVLTGLSFNGKVAITDLATNASFTGTTTIELVELNVDSAEDPTDPNPLSLSEVTLTGVFADSSNSFTADLSLIVNNATNFDTIAFLSSSLYLVETTDNYIEATLTVSLDLLLDGYPDTKAVVTVDRAELDSGSVILTLSQDLSTFTIKADVVDAGDPSGLVTVTVTNPDGVAIVVTPATDTYPTTGDLTVDGVNVGTVEESDGLLLIRYVDGTFETLY